MSGEHLPGRGADPSPTAAAAAVVLRAAVTALLVAGVALVMFQSALTSLVGAAVALPAAAAFVLARHRLLGARLPLALLLLFLWMAASVTWSHEPSATLRAAVGTGLLLALGVLLAWGRDATELPRTVMWAATWVSVVAVAMAVALPGTALADGLLRGPTPHENQLGFIAAVGLLTAVVCTVERRVSRLTGVAVGSLAAVCLLWSGSRTGLLITVVTVASFAVMRALGGLPRRWQAPLLMLTLLGGGLGVLVAVLNRAFVAEALGRDVTLTGRTEIWQVVWTLANERPLTGWGLGSVWRASSPVGATVERAISYFPSHAHNGYLDTFLQTGAVGAVLLVLALLGALARGTRQLLLGGSAFPLATAVLLVLYNLSETRFLDHAGWLLLAVVCAPVTAWGPDRTSLSADAGPVASSDGAREEDLRWRYRTT